MVMLVVMLTVWRFFPPKEVCSRAGAWATGRITRDCVFTHRCYTQKLLRTKAFTQRSLYTKLLYTQEILHTEVFTQKSFYTEKFLPTEALHREVSTQSRGKENSHFTSRLCFRYTRSPQRFAPAQTMQIRVGDARSPQRVTFLISFDGRGLAASAAKREKFRKTWEAGVL